MPKTALTPKQQNIKTLAAHIVASIKKGKPRADGSGSEELTKEEINAFLGSIKTDADWGLDDSGGWLIPDQIRQEEFIAAIRADKVVDIAADSEYLSPVPGATDEGDLFANELLIGFNEALSIGERLEKIGAMDDFKALSRNSLKSRYLHAKFENMKLEEGLPEWLTAETFFSLVTHVSDVVLDGGDEMQLGKNREATPSSPSKQTTGEEKAKLKAERRVLALIGDGVDKDGRAINRSRIANIAIELAKSLDGEVVESLDGDEADGDEAADAKKTITEAIKKIEEGAGVTISRILKANVARKKAAKAEKEKEELIAKEKAEAEEAAKKALTDDGWPKYLSRSELGARGYLSNPINIFGTSSKAPASGIHHGSELYESGLVVQLFEDDRENAPSGSFKVSRQISAIANSGVKTGVTFVRTKPFGGEESYQLIIATSVGVVQTFTDPSEFENIKTLFKDQFRLELVGVLDPVVVIGNFHDCLSIYREAMAGLLSQLREAETAGADEDRERIREVMDVLGEEIDLITEDLSSENYKEAYTRISTNASPDSVFFTDEEKERIRKLRDAGLDKATDIQKEAARVLAAKSFSELLQKGHERFSEEMNRHIELDSLELERCAKEMFVDPTKAKHLLNQPAPPCRIGSTAIMMPNGNTATALFNNDVSQNNIIYLAVPNTKNAYVRVIRLPEGSPVGVYRNGGLQMVTSDKPGVIAIDEGVVWRCTESGDHEPVELSSRGKGFTKYEWENVKANAENFNVKAMSVSGNDRYMQTMCGGKVVGAQLGQSRIFDACDQAGVETGLRIERKKDGQIILPADGLPETVLRTIKREDGVVGQIMVRLVASKEPKKSPQEDQKYTAETFARFYNASGEKLKGWDRKGQLTEENLTQFFLGENPEQASKEEEKAAKDQASEVAKDLAKKTMVVTVVDALGKEKKEAVSMATIKRGLFDDTTPLPVPRDPSAVLLVARTVARTI